MAKNDDVVFDSKSGISIEEQKEILAKINGIAERNRRSLSQGARAENTVAAKKSGALFPLIINAAALVILIGGGLFLVSFNGRVDEQVREGRAVYDLGERELLEKIRGETEEKIAVKESEISKIQTQLNDVDAQLNLLQSSNQELTAEQRATQQRLLALQESYSKDLAALQEERSRILEDARQRENVLRAQLEERAREFAASQQKSRAELDSAMSELDKLASEQERVAAIDAQLSGGLAAVSGMVAKGDYENAARSIESLKIFCNNNTYSNSKIYLARKEFYNKSIDSMELMVDDMRKYRSGDQWSLQDKNIKLQEEVDEMKKTIDSISSGSSGQTTRIAELTTAVSALENTVEEKDKAIKTLEGEKAAVQTESAKTQNRLDNIQKVIEGKNVTDMTIGELMDNLDKIITALEK